MTCPFCCNGHIFCTLAQFEFLMKFLDFKLRFVGMMMSEMEALSEVIEFGWTSATYTKNRVRSKRANALRHPSWDQVRKAKKLCLPPGIEYHESFVSCPVQNVLHHHLSKILKDKEIVAWMKRLKESNRRIKFILKYKYGADGTSGMSHYKNSTIKDKSLFASNLVPLFIEAIDIESGKSVNVWANPFANSALGVVPLRWSFEKETTGM